GVEEEGQHEVHRRPAGHDDDLLPPLLAVEDAVLVAGPDLLQGHLPGLFDQGLERAGGGAADFARVVAGLGRQHADHADVSAQRQPFDAVLGLAAAPRPQGGPEPDHVLGHLDAEELGGQEVADLVQPDGRHQPDEEDGDPQEEEPVHKRVLQAGSIERPKTSRTRTTRRLTRLLRYTADAYGRQMRTSAQSSLWPEAIALTRARAPSRNPEGSSRSASPSSRSSPASMSRPGCSISPSV